ncbi:glycosyltransferase [Salinisphaera sp. SPP-AMP-43]|uniref:glycosyltransferase n=1 Tax=Salinisphaera sp. SPP-AMP-43 TaxID=3121288 RepID=UPI003C6E3336
MKRPICFFVHHQGRGHAARTRAIVSRMAADRPVSVATADPSLFDGFQRDIELIELPNMIGARVPTAALHAHATPETMHCVPLGLREMRVTMRRILDHLDDRNVGLFAIDVSAELAQLARIASVPAVKVRMHGSRNDPGHQAAYAACTGMLAPFDAALEQPDYPDRLRAKTFYTGGLCTHEAVPPAKAEARRRLGLPDDAEIVLAMAGGGGHGLAYAPLTVAARAAPETLFVTVGRLHREGHETDFANLVNHGWVEHTAEYIAAADIVVASAGDNMVTEIAKVGRPYVCIPEWRYFDEQSAKAERLAAVGAALHVERQPGDLVGWQAILEQARQLDVARLQPLHDPSAAEHAAGWLEATTDRLWDSGATLARPQEAVIDLGSRRLAVGSDAGPIPDQIG